MNRTPPDAGNNEAPRPRDSQLLHVIEIDRCSDDVSTTSASTTSVSMISMVIEQLCALRGCELLLLVG